MDKKAVASQTPQEEGGFEGAVPPWFAPLYLVACFSLLTAA